MLHHVSLGVRDIEAAARFYDAILEALGYARVWEDLRPGQDGQALSYCPSVARWPPAQDWPMPPGPSPRRHVRLPRHALASRHRRAAAALASVQSKMSLSQDFLR
jgi:catechol 2,3-dioxygenase-like lactoylglutathione lyase family enzyme